MRIEGAKEGRFVRDRFPSAPAMDPVALRPESMLLPVCLTNSKAGRTFDARLAERHPKSFPAAPGCQLVLLGLACLLGANAPSTLVLRLGLSADLVLAISGAKMAFLALYVGVVYIYFRRHARWFLAAAAGAAGLALFGPSLQQTMHALAAAARWIARGITCVIPSTRTGWGILGIVASFLLLGVGLVISLRRPPENGDHHAPVPEPDPQSEHSAAPQADAMPPILC